MANDMKIYIPHLDYTVIVKDLPKEKPLANCTAYTMRIDSNSTELFIKRPVGRSQSSLLAHEVTHVLQNIAYDRDIEFPLEKEHFGYLMQYIHGKVMGLSWK